MPWNLVLIIASGVGAALITAIVFRDLKSRKLNSGVFFAALFVVLGTVTHILLLPKIQHPEHQKAAVEYLQNNRLFSLLAEDNSEFRNEFLDFMDQTLRTSKTRDEAFERGTEWGRKKIAPYFVKYLPYASDKAIYNFSVYFGNVLKEVNKRDAEACVTWMYGLKGRSPAVGKAIREATSAVGRDKMTSVMADVVQSSIQSPVYVERTDKDTKMMRDFVQGLSSRYGKRFTNGLVMSARPNAPSNNRKDMCYAAEILYTEVVRLPETKRKAILRNMFAIQKS